MSKVTIFINWAQGPLKEFTFGKGLDSATYVGIIRSRFLIIRDGFIQLQPLDFGHPRPYRPADIISNPDCEGLRFKVLITCAPLGTLGITTPVDPADVVLEARPFVLDRPKFRGRDVIVRESRMASSATMTYNNIPLNDTAIYNQPSAHFGMTVPTEPNRMDNPIVSYDRTTYTGITSPSTAIAYNGTMTISSTPTIRGLSLTSQTTADYNLPSFDGNLASERVRNPNDTVVLNRFTGAELIESLDSSTFPRGRAMVSEVTAPTMNRDPFTVDLSTVNSIRAVHGNLPLTRNVAYEGSPTGTETAAQALTELYGPQTENVLDSRYDY